MESLQQGLQGFENQMVTMHSQFGEGKHFYQIETAKLKEEETERLKHELSLVRSELDRVRQAGREDNRDQLEALREIVQEQKQTREKVGVIYCFGANPVPRDFEKKIVQELQIVQKKKQCPPYLANILDLCLPPQNRKLRRDCGL